MPTSHGSFPAMRLRRLRQAGIRELVRETTLQA